MFSSRLFFKRIRKNFSRRLLPVLFSLILGTFPAASGSGGEPVPLPDFSGVRAMELLTAQCDLGTRIPGSAGNRQLREMVLELARKHGFKTQVLCFEATDPMTDQPVQVCNIIASSGPEGGQRLWLGAHYDTRPVCDRDPDPELRSSPLVGANDGASGVAVLLHLMEILGANPPPQGVDFLFFDGEDSGLAGDPSGFCLGSRQLAATCRDFGNPLSQGTPRGLIVLDMVGKKNLQIPMEAYSLVNAPEWTEAVFDRAAQLGLAAFVPQRGPGVYDDHVPFLEMGIPAVDLIDFDFPEWHTTGDTPEICSASSLTEVGRLMLDLIYNP